METAREYKLEKKRSINLGPASKSIDFCIFFRRFAYAIIKNNMHNSQTQNSLVCKITEAAAVVSKRANVSERERERKKSQAGIANEQTFYKYARNDDEK